MADAAELRARPRRVYRIGGGSGAGKSTIARRLAAEHGLRVYATDAVMREHGARAAPGDSPFLTAFAAMNMDERWLNRSPEVTPEQVRVRQPGLALGGLRAIDVGDAMTEDGLARRVAAALGLGAAETT